MENIIKDKIFELAELFESYEEKIDFTDDQLRDITFARTNVMLSKTFDKHLDKLTEEQMNELSGELGKSIWQTTNLFAGVDLSKLN